MAFVDIVPAVDLYQESLFLCPKHMQETCMDSLLKSGPEALAEPPNHAEGWRYVSPLSNKSYQNSQAIHWELCWKGTLESLPSQIKVHFAMCLPYFNTLLYPAKCLKIQLTVTGWNGMFS